jgi:hypothetical protein
MFFFYILEPDKVLLLIGMLYAGTIPILIHKPCIVKVKEAFRRSLKFAFFRRFEVFFCSLCMQGRKESMQMAANISSWKILTAAQASASAHFSCNGGGVLYCAKHFLSTIVLAGKSLLAINPLTLLNFQRCLVKPKFKL